jgi:transcriptional regulator with XRE-family HTH domain
MEVPEIQPWLFQVEPLQRESLSHFLGRFRRANDLTPTGLGKATKLGGAIARWEKFRFNPPPSRQQLEALAKVVEVDADRLAQMLPPAGVGMKLEPIRLCAACYVESPCHKIECS